MPARLLRPLRRNFVSYIAIFLALGGGYAIAASSTKTIRGCVVKRTGELLIQTHCTSAQRTVSWNERGPQGLAGRQGAPGVTVWAEVSANGFAFQGSGISAQHVSAGTYQITITAPACAGRANAPTITVSDSNPPAGQTAGAFPTAWIGESVTNQQFTVFTGVVTGGVFTAGDHSFTVQDACG
jgi:hypothetical protein